MRKEDRRSTRVVAEKASDLAVVVAEKGMTIEVWPNGSVSKITPPAN